MYHLERLASQSLESVNVWRQECGAVCEGGEVVVLVLVPNVTQFHVKFSSALIQYDRTLVVQAGVLILRHVVDAVVLESLGFIPSQSSPWCGDGVYNYRFLFNSFFSRHCFSHNTMTCGEHPLQLRQALMWKSQSGTMSGLLLLVAILVMVCLDNIFWRRPLLCCNFLSNFSFTVEFCNLP